MPEALTRDIINPVKERGGIGEIIKEFEQEQMQQRIFATELVPREWHDELSRFTINEFASSAFIEQELRIVSSDQINKQYCDDKYNPIDGELIKVADDLAAFLEVYLAIEHDLERLEFLEAKTQLQSKYTGKTVAGLPIGTIYASFS